MPEVLKLMADYSAFPLWKDGGNVGPDHLPLTAELKAALLAWGDTFEQTLNHDYPPDSGFASPAEEEAFEAEGRRLWRALQEQLGAEYKVVYFSERDRRLHE